MTKVRTGFRILSVVILVLAVLQILRSRPADANETKTNSDSSESLATVAETLEKKRKELEDKEKLLAEKEEQLKIQAAEIEKRIQRIEELRLEISGELAKRRQQSEERVQKMVSVFETMSPKSAAQIMETLDDELSVEVLKRMDAKRVAKVMNVMDKGRSARLSERLTGYMKTDFQNSTDTGRSVASQAAKADATVPEKTAGQLGNAKSPMGNAGSNLEKGGKR